jgi:poly(A) polymerase
VDRLNAEKWRRTLGVAPLLKALGARQGLSRYVGGAVRDELLGLAVNDVDIATRLRPKEVIERLEQAGLKAVPTGIEHGTITAVSHGHPFEITSLRRDVSTDGRRAIVEYTDDWKEDAARRDFTINALMADPISGEIFDYFGGLEDLRARRIRFIGDPLQRIAEDHLRILRFFRFYARFADGPPNASALEACTARANDLMALSRERIADEMLKLLGVANPAPTVRLMVEQGILAPVLPEIELSAVSRLSSLVASELDAKIAADPLRRLVSLLPAQPEIAERVAARLKLSNKQRRRAGCAAETNLAANPSALAYQVGSECAVDRLLLAGRAEDAGYASSWTPPRLPITGGELITRGVPQGPEVARKLREIECQWVAAGFPDGPEFEALAARVLGLA